MLSSSFIRYLKPAFTCSCINGDEEQLGLKHVALWKANFSFCNKYRWAMSV